MFILIKRLLSQATSKCYLSQHCLNDNLTCLVICAYKVRDVDRNEVIT